MKNNRLKNALNQELEHVRVSEDLKRRIIMAAKAGEKRRRQSIARRWICGTAAAFILLLGASTLIISRRPAIPDVQNRPLSQTSYTPTPAPTEQAAEMKMVWMTQGGVYYHDDEHCSGMRNAKQVELEAAEEQGKIACPICVLEGDSIYTETPTPTEQANISVDSNYIVGDSIDMPTPAPTKLETPVPTEQANISETSKYTPVPEPKDEQDDVLMQESHETENVEVANPSELVWATQNGKYYHADEHCSGMMNAGQITIYTALLWEKQPCPICQPEGILYTELPGLEMLSVTGYGDNMGEALLVEYAYEEVFETIDKPDALKEGYGETIETDSEVFDLSAAVQGMISIENCETLNEEYSRKGEVGFRQNDMRVVCTDIATQNTKSTLPLPEGEEYHFYDPDAPSNGSVLYAFSENNAWTGDHVCMSCKNIINEWYYDGNKIYQDTVFEGDVETVKTALQDGGEVQYSEYQMDISGNRILAKLWRMDTAKILVLEPESGVTLAETATRFMDEEGEKIPAAMLLKPDSEEDNRAGWIFRGDAMPESGTTFVVALKEGEIKSFPYELLETGGESYADDSVTVWATENGVYYHADEHCSGMENAIQMQLMDATFFSDRKPCPICNPPEVNMETDDSGIIVSMKFSDDDTGDNAEAMAIG